MTRRFLIGWTAFWLLAVEQVVGELFSLKQSECNQSLLSHARADTRAQTLTHIELDGSELLTSQAIRV